MGVKKCVPKNIKLKCSESPAFCNLNVINPTMTMNGVDVATEADVKFGVNFTGFGTCGKTGQACAAIVTSWDYTTEPSLVCAGNKLLTNESELACATGGTITIMLDEPIDTIDAPNVLDKAQASINGVVNKVTAPLDKIQENANDLASKATGGLSGFGKKIGGFFGGIADSGKELASSVGESVSDGFDSVVESGQELATSVGESIDNVVEEVGLIADDVKRHAGNLADEAVLIGSDVKRHAVDFINADGIDKFGRTVDGVGNVLGLARDGVQIAGDTLGVGSEVELVTEVIENTGKVGLAIAGKLGEGTLAVSDHVNEYYEDPSGRWEKDVEIAKAVGNAAIDGAEKAVDASIDYAGRFIDDPTGTVKDTHASLVSATVETAEKAVEFSDWYMNEATEEERHDVVANGAIDIVKLGAGGTVGKYVGNAVGAATNKVIGATGQAAKAAVGKVTGTLGQVSESIKGFRQLKKGNADGAEFVTKSNKPETKVPKGDNPNGDANKNEGENEDGSGCPGPKGSCKNDPVEIISGAMFYPGEDFEIPGVIPLKWERTWYSDSKYKGPLGHGFHHSYDIHLEERAKDLLLWLPTGQSAFFPKLTEEITSDYNRIEKLTLSKLENGNYTVFNHKTQLSYDLNEKEPRVYRLTKISNSNSVSIRFEYHNNALSKIIDTVGRVVNIISNKDDKIAKIEISHKGQKKELVSYAYNDANDLNGITDSLGKTTKMRYKNHLMVAKTDRNGQTFYWEYDGLKTGAKCIHTWGDGGFFEGFMEYHKEYTIYKNEVHGRSVYYHKNGMCTKEIDALGGESIKEYNDYNELVKSIDEEGNETLFEYDDKGNLTAIQYPDKAIEEFTYDEKGRLQITTKPEGGTSVYAYKEERLDTIIQANGMMSTFEYNKNGTISKVYDNLDNETQLFYDEDYNLIKLISSNESVSSWEYDEWSQCIKAINPQKHVQEFSYDINGRVTEVNLPDQNTIKLKYNAYEEVVEVVDKNSTIKFEYTPLGSLKTRTENGKKVYFQYNSQEELMGIVNEHNEAYKFTRDFKGNIIKEEGFDGLTRNFYRDRAGKVVKVERPDEKHSVYEYDKGGRISRIEHHDGTWATYNYNKDGLLIEAINPNSHVKLKRDEAGRILSENQDGYTVMSQYGELGIRTGIKSSLGAVINFQHSSMGEVMEMHAKTSDSKPWEANFMYNSLGMETERVLPGNVVSSWNYDTAGLPKEHTVKNKGREQRSRLYTWDVNSKLQKITNNLTNKLTSFTYDAFNNLASAKYEDNSYDYKLPDEVGNLYRTKEKNDREYGKSGRLLRSGATHYHYDEEGNLLKKENTKGSWKYSWEAGGMLQNVLKPDKTFVAFEYDALGRRTSKIVKEDFNEENTITRFIWDGNVPLHEWKYELKDRPRAIIDELGQVSKDTKEPLENLITWIFDQGAFRPAAKITKDETYSIITDYLGTPVEMYNSKGEKTWQVEYDIYGKIRKQVKGNSQDCPFRYQGQYEDYEIGLYYNRFRYYASDEGVYISQDPIGLKGGQELYAYVHDSNTFVDVLGLNGGSVFRGDVGYNGGDIGSPLGNSGADITTPWEHTRMGDNPTGKTSAFKSFTTNSKTASFFGAGKMSNVSKVSMADLRKLEAEGKIKIHTPQSVADMMKKSGNKKLRIDANNVKQIMEKNGEILVEGVVDKSLIKSCP